MKQTKKIKTIDDLLYALFERKFLVSLNQGRADVINGYGWHQIFIIQIIKQEDFCEICEITKNPNHTGQHKWSKKDKTLHKEEYLFKDKLIVGVCEFLKQFDCPHNKTTFMEFNNKTVCTACGKDVHK